jgi:Domain of unknown function (DUF3854)
MSDALLPQHEALLRDSAIAPAVARDRGYRSVTVRADLHRLGFSARQARVPALLIPIRDVHGEVALYQARPDEPRILDGRSVKYETPKGARMALDVPPSVRAMLGDPGVPLFITEGVRKADSAASIGLCCIALLGVWNWRGTNEQGGRHRRPPPLALRRALRLALDGRLTGPGPGLPVRVEPAHVHAPVLRAHPPEAIGLAGLLRERLHRCMVGLETEPRAADAAAGLGRGHRPGLPWLARASFGAMRSITHSTGCQMEGPSHR